MSNLKPNLAASWKPNTLQNRCRNLEKSKLKNNTLLASIFEGFGRRFGRPETSKIAISPRREHDFSKIDVFKKVAILGGFGVGFGRPKSSIFARFSTFFRCKFRHAFRKAKNSVKNAKKPKFSAFWRRAGGVRGPPGERFREGYQDILGLE